MELRRALYSIVERALALSGIGADAMELSDRGDGMLVLAAGTVSRTTLVDAFIGHLVTGLRTHNLERRLDDWLRLRVALHSGDARRDARGWGGRELTLTFRLCEADAVKRCLAAAGRAQCVLTVSDHFYRTVVAHGDGGIDPATYRPLDFTSQEGPTRAWVRVPGYPVPPTADPPLAAATPAPPDPVTTNYFMPGRDYNDLRGGGVVNNHASAPR